VRVEKVVDGLVTKVSARALKVGLGVSEMGAVHLGVVNPWISQKAAE